jgi:hypothetical protein
LPAEKGVGTKAVSTVNTTQRLHGLDFLRASMMLLGIVLHGAQMYMTMQLGFAQWTALPQRIARLKYY